jgi:hypothetical protein
VLHSVFAAA